MNNCGHSEQSLVFLARVLIRKFCRKGWSMIWSSGGLVCMRELLLSLNLSIIRSMISFTISLKTVSLSKNERIDVYMFSLAISLKTVSQSNERYIYMLGPEMSWHSLMPSLVFFSFCQEYMHLYQMKGGWTFSFLSQKIWLTYFQPTNGNAKD